MIFIDICDDPTMLKCERCSYVTGIMSTIMLQTGIFSVSKKRQHLFNFFIIFYQLITLHITWATIHIFSKRPSFIPILSTSALELVKWRTQAEFPLVTTGL